MVTLIKHNIREMQFFSAGSFCCLLFFSSVWAGWDPPEKCDFESSSCIWETGEDTTDWKWERSSTSEVGAGLESTNFSVSGERFPTSALRGLQQTERGELRVIIMTIIFNI